MNENRTEDRTEKGARQNKAEETGQNKKEKQIV